ncbi:MAG: hypothetical protein ABW321_32890 [Polyangiales bacterium]
MFKWLNETWPASACRGVCLALALAATDCGDDDDTSTDDSITAGSGGSSKAGSGGTGSAGKSAADGGKSGAATGDSDDADGGTAGSGGDPGSAGSSSVGSGAKPLYAAVYDVSSAEETDAYLSVFDSLDVEKLDTSNAREFAGGHASMQVYNNWIFVGEPSNSVVHRFSVGENGALEDEREISFAMFGQPEANIDDWYINFISPTKAYSLIYTEGTTVIWNPATMEIEGTIDAPDGYVRAGAYTNNSAGVVRDKRLYRAFYWGDESTGVASEDQILVVYDTEKDEITAIVKETRCQAPGNRAFAGEDGTLYFSSWTWPISDTILYGSPPHCVLRIKAGDDKYDADWSFTYRDVADGRDGGVFTYLKDGQGLAAIFHDEDIPHDKTTDPYVYAGSANWELWRVDINAKTGSPIAGIPRNGGAYSQVTLDQRNFVMIPSDDFSKTQLYEIDGKEAKAGLVLPGWSYKMAQVR